MKKERCAVFSGTFDPVTSGHLDIIRRALALFDTVHVLIAVNPEKKTMFSEGDRLRMLEASVSSLEGSDRVVCKAWERPVFEYCKTAGAEYIVKGVRNSTDFEYEKVLSAQTASLCPGIETVLFMSPEKYSYISSTYVRGCIEYGFSLDGAVPKEAIELIGDIICK
ncbi:MAG: pantetheine-phosphate adenylyltransferase [Clostridia bacterium]|nr:pantetheine-phosphate adenylyltransferase [Clostridia bacterium]